MESAGGIDSAAVDDESATRIGTNARLAVITIINDKCARTVDGELITRRKLDAFLGVQGFTLIKKEYHVATNVNALIDGDIGRYSMNATHFCGRGCDRDTVAHCKVDGLTANVTSAYRCEGKRVVSLFFDG